MKSRIVSALSFLRIIDAHDGQISLTNAALLIVLFKIQVAQAVGMTEIGGLLIALLSYQSKKVINGKVQDDSENALNAAVQKTKEELEAKVIPAIQALEDQSKKMNEVQSGLAALQLKLGLQVKR